MTEHPSDDEAPPTGLFGRSEPAPPDTSEPLGLPGALTNRSRPRRAASWSDAADRALVEEAEREERARRAEVVQRALEAERSDEPIPITTDTYTGPELLTEPTIASPDSTDSRRAVVLGVSALIVALALAAIFFWPNGGGGPSLTPLDELAANEFDTVLPADIDGGALGGEQLEVRVVVGTPDTNGVVEVLVTFANTGTGSVALSAPELLVNGPEPTRVSPPSGNPLEVGPLEPGEIVQGHLAWRVSAGSTNGRLLLAATPLLERALPVF